MGYRADTNVPHGNACGLEVSECGEGWSVDFSPASHGDPEALWFCFRVVAEGEIRQGGNLTLNLRHPGNLLSMVKPQTIRPVIRRAQQDWERLGEGTVLEHPDGRWDLSWKVAAPTSTLEVAFCFPYGTREVEELETTSGGGWKRDRIGYSAQGRPLERLSNGYGEEAGTRAGLYLMARQHSGETSASWVLDGFLRRLGALGDRAPLVWCVPLANIDGVEQGDYGKDSFPWDFNRAWGHPAMRHEILVLQRDIKRFAARCRPVLGFDFHSPGASCDGCHVYLPSEEAPSEVRPQASAFAEAMEKSLDPAHIMDPFARVVNYKSRWEAPMFATYFVKETEAPGLTFEAPYAMAGQTVLTIEGYREHGRRLADAVVKVVKG